MKWLNFAIGSVVLVAAGVFLAVKFGSFEIRRLEREVDRLEQERQALLDYADRLSASRRVAQVDVLSQQPNERGHTVTRLAWQEIGPDGLLGRRVEVEAVGHLVYFEALVIKFERRFIQQADAERGASLALFRRIFGDQQAPESVPELDRLARPPVRVPNQSTRLQDELWARFWDLVDDPQLAVNYGVRIVQCEAPAVPLKVGEIWEVSLDAAGGVNLRKLSPGAAPGG